MIAVEIEDPAWTAALPAAAELALQAAQAAVDGHNGEIVILLTDDEAVQDLNRRFLAKDRPTNVLAFPDVADDRLGDIALAFGVCQAEATQQAKPLSDHLRHLVVHGVLHLLGYDHGGDEDAARMEALERRLLTGMSIPDPYAPIPTPRGRPPRSIPEPMSADSPDRTPPGAPDARRPLSGWLERMGWRLVKRDAASEEAAVAGADLMDHARAFQTVTVADVMIPRADIKAVELSASLEALVAAFVESEHSRLPVYRESLDDPVGVAHLKDVFSLIAAPGERANAGGAVLRRLKRDALYVPPSMRAADLLVRMQSSRIHMAMVIDEFGGVDGLVTLEDVLEAVVGEIDDEHDEAQLIQIVARPGGLFEVDARTPLEDLQTALGHSLITDDMENEDIDTAAGLVTALAGRVPQRGEIIVHPLGFDFEVTDADPRRVKRLRVRAATPAADG